MVNRLTEFIAQTKGISTNRWIYFDRGKSYTFDKEQLLQAFTDFTEDKKGGEYFKDKTFKIQVDDFNDYIKNYKKNINGLEFNENNDIRITTDLPYITDLTFEWTKEDTLKLNKIKTFFKELDSDNSNKIFDYTFSKEETAKFINEKSNRMFADLTNNCILFEEDNNLESYLMISIFPKYLGKLLSSTKEFTLKIYNTDKDSIYLIHYVIRNSNITSEYFGLCSDLIPLQEGGCE